jgi:transposase
MSEKIKSLLELGDPNAEASLAYRVKEALSDFYEIPEINAAREALLLIDNHAKKKSMPPELKRLARTIEKWFEKIMAYHLAKVTNAPTEGLNNLIKRIKRVGFGFRNFDNYRIRALLYAGKPNYRILSSIVAT